MENMLKQLQKSGLPEKSALVYATLLEMGGGYPSKIAERTHLNRSTVYKILVDLSVKGLVSGIDRHKKLFYQVEKPDRLLKYAKSSKEIAEERYERVRELMPEIEGLYSMSPNKPKIRFFENKEGLKSILEDHISEKEPYEMLGFANTAELEKFMTPEYLRRYAKVKEQIGVTTRGIVPDSETDRGFTGRIYRGIRKNVWLNLRYIPKEKFPFNGEITIYGKNKVSIVNFNDTQTVGIIIEDKPIHEMMVRIFELAWIGAASSEMKRG